MPIGVALLRGINVGGKNILPMKALVAILEECGFSDVRTYIQSGNAVFRYNKKGDIARHAADLGTEIGRRHGFEPKVLLLTLDEVKRALESNPFPEATDEPKTLHLNFLDALPANPDCDALERLKSARERFVLKGRVFYLYAPDGIGRSKLAARAETLVGVTMTGRNWGTASKIVEMGEALSSSSR